MKFSKDISMAKKLILDNSFLVKKFGSKKGIFSKYSRFYITTNEAIKEYFQLIDFNNITNALTVMGSGDQMFNLVYHGVYDIDIFDVNILSEYWVLGLKRAMLINLSYQEYSDLISRIISDNIDYEELIEILNTLLPDMDRKYRNFWNNIINFAYSLKRSGKIDKNLFGLLGMDTIYQYRFDVKDFVANNYYLSNEEDYELLKTNLGKANLRFQNADITKLSDIYQKKFDLVLLSNILDYVKKSNNTLLNDLEGLLRTDGILFLHYIFNGLIIKLPELLKEREYEIKNFPSFSNKNNGIIYKRIK